MGNSPSGSDHGSVSQHVEQSKKTGVCSLKDRKLTRFPEQLAEVKATLRTLDISTNQLIQLPPVIGEFRSLKSLNLSHNKLAQLPEALGGLKRLEILILESNDLASLPESCLNIKTLRTVNLSRNKLKSFPLFLCQLPQLDFADLSGNLIDELPEGIEVLNAVELNVSNNNISILPASLAKCKRLKVLRVQENTLPLAGIPPAILADSNIALFCVEGNLFEVKELKDLPEYEKYLERYTATKRKAD